MLVTLKFFLVSGQMGIVGVGGCVGGQGVREGVSLF